MMKSTKVSIFAVIAAALLQAGSAPASTSQTVPTVQAEVDDRIFLGLQGEAEVGSTPQLLVQDGDPGDPNGLPGLELSDVTVARADIRSVPEPATLSLMGIGALGVFLAARRRKRA